MNADGGPYLIDVSLTTKILVNESLDWTAHGTWADNVPSTTAACWRGNMLTQVSEVGRNVDVVLHWPLFRLDDRNCVGNDAKLDDAIWV